MFDLRSTDRDERTEAVENASSALAYKFVAFALLLDVMYRSLRFGDPSWDLMAIVVASGAIVTYAQLKQRIVTRNWVRTWAIVFAIALVAAAVLVMVVLRTR